LLSCAWILGSQSRIISNVALAQYRGAFTSPDAGSQVGGVQGIVFAYPRGIDSWLTGFVKRAGRAERTGRSDRGCRKRNRLDATGKRLLRCGKYRSEDNLDLIAGLYRKAKSTTIQRNSVALAVWPNWHDLPAGLLHIPGWLCFLPSVQRAALNQEPLTRCWTDRRQMPLWLG